MQIEILNRLLNSFNACVCEYFSHKEWLSLVRFWLATFWLTKSLVCKDVFNRDSTIQSDVRRFCTSYKSEEFGSLSAVRTTCHPVQTLICPLFHPSRRRAIPSGRWQNKNPPSGGRGFPSGTFTVSRSFCSSLHPSGRLSSPSGLLSVIDQASDSFQVRIWEDCFNRPDACLHKASSQFKLNRLDVSLPWSGRPLNWYGNCV